MGLKDIFKSNKKTPNEIISFNEIINSLDESNYFSYKEKLHLLSFTTPIFDKFIKLKDYDLLQRYCKNNKFNYQNIIDFLDNYKNIDNLITNNNEQYINKKLVEEKQYLDDILKDCDKNINLDIDQRKCVLNDEDYCMIIAGAGAGKTTTIAAKVKYLVDKKHIDPKDILIVSFTNKAVNELKDRINNNLNIDCPISTFHAVGNAILRKDSSFKLNVVSEELMHKIITDFFVNKLEDKKLIDEIVMFFGSYFDYEYDEECIDKRIENLINSDFTTIKSNLNEYSKTTTNKLNKNKVTLNNEVVNSYQELRIANFLYLNGIEYEYEPEYPYFIENSFKRYTPDFLIKQDDKVIYLEHFSLSEDGKHSSYSEEEIEKYKKAINDKILLHRNHQTKLIYTFSKYNDNVDILVHLKNLLLNEGIVLNKRDSKEIIDKLKVIEENKYFMKLTNLVKNFISNFKTNNYNELDFDNFILNSKNVRTKLFLKIAKECYLEYQQYLINHNSLDFADMINNAAKLLKEKQELKEKLSFKYLIIDEYQDISRQRFDLVKELSKVCDAKITVVGDDWQSIYAFSGSDVSLFTNFKEKMGYCSMLKITNTYRNSQEMIDIAGSFIQKNSLQIKKALVSPKHIDDPIIIYSYDDAYKKSDNSNKGKNYNLSSKIEEIIGLIYKDKPNAKILLVGRYNFDGYKLTQDKLFDYNTTTKKVISKKYPKADITFLTAHSSKGLGYDEVILINACDGTFGFPSQIEDDPVMNLVTVKSDEISFAEERRLFYVALTRTKNRVYIVAPIRHPSKFIIELLDNYKNIKLIGDLDPQDSKVNVKKCPICGFPLVRRFKADVGLGLWCCSNEPELCGFLTNNLKGKNLSICKCDKCRDGYLVVKSKEDRYFLACTNYKKDNSGCNNLIDMNFYNLLTNYKEERIIDESLVSSSIIHGFDIIIDKEGNALTDIDLLKQFITIRDELSKKMNTRNYIICSNFNLVKVATYLPKNKNEFINIHGLGDKIYNNIGFKFVDLINKKYN